MRYANRATAGQKLGSMLSDTYGNDVAVVALSPGAVELGVEVAKALRSSLELLLVGKITHPYDSSYELGAFTTGRLPVYSYPAMEEIDQFQLNRQLAYARTQLHINELLYNPYVHEQPAYQDKVVVLVDDGIASGLTMQAAAQAISEYLPAEIVAAVTVASDEGSKRMAPYVDKLLVLEHPHYFPGKLSHYYKHFVKPDVPTVRKLLQQANHSHVPVKHRLVQTRH